MDVSTSDTGEVFLPAALEGDPVAFGKVIKSYDKQMRPMAYRMLGSQAAMDDALQDAYLKAFQALGSFRGDAKFSTWLYRIVWRTCIDHLRKQSRDNTRPLDDVAEPHERHSFEDTVVTNAALLDALQQLSEDQRAILLLIDAEGFSYDEAANLLGIEVGTVSSRISRARSNIRRLLKATDGVDGLGGTL